MFFFKLKKMIKDLLICCFLVIISIFGIFISIRISIDFLACCTLVTFLLSLGAFFLGLFLNYNSSFYFVRYISIFKSDKRLFILLYCLILYCYASNIMPCLNSNFILDSFVKNIISYTENKVSLIDFKLSDSFGDFIPYIMALYILTSFVSLFFGIFNSYKANKREIIKNSGNKCK